MQNILRILTFVLLIPCLMHAQQRTTVNFGSDWEFKREEVGSSWQKVNIPHTAKIESLVVVKQFQGTSAYRKTFNPGKIKDKNIFIHFEGVMQEAEIRINGKTVMLHKGGYLPFTVDATKHLKPDAANTIEVSVVNIDNPQVPPGKAIKDLDFNYYGGIYRNVQLITTSNLHITDAVHANKTASGGVFVNFNKITSESAAGTIKVHLQNNHKKAKDVSLSISMTAPDGNVFQFKSGKSKIGSNSDLEIVQSLKLASAKLWSVNNPQLYTLKVDVVSGKKIIDTHSEKIGIRLSELRTDGYYLNGEKIYIAGTNRHQEYPYVGYAISDEAQYRDAVKIKNAGFDFVRLSHYPQADAFLRACDELGILVMNSIPGWQFFGDETFQQNALQTVREMARRDRNHPSVVFWEVSLNESGMTEAFMKKANDVLREELPFAGNYTAGWIDDPSYDLYIPARQHGKAPDWWTNYNKGNRKIFIAEYGDWEYYAQNAGFNQKEFSNLKEEERTSRQLRSAGEKRLLQQAFNFQEASNSNRKGAATIGEANWLMFDYNRGYSPDLESSGISDIFRIPKFAYYFYQSQRDADVKLSGKLFSGPMVNIATYWTPESSPAVTVYSNCDEVALYLNDKLIARQKPTVNANSDSLDHPPFVFQTGGFKPGTLRAEGFIGGKKVADHIVKTPGQPAKIVLEYDLSSVPVNIDTPDVIFVYAKITDANGTVIPNATDLVTFSLEGQNATLIGNPVNAEAGVATVLLRTENFKTPLQITAKSTNLQSASIQIKP